MTGSGFESVENKKFAPNLEVDPILQGTEVGGDGTLGKRVGVRIDGKFAVRAIVPILLLFLVQLGRVYEEEGGGGINGDDNPTGGTNVGGTGVNGILILLGLLGVTLFFGAH